MIELKILIGGAVTAATSVPGPNETTCIGPDVSIIIFAG